MYAVWFAMYPGDAPERWPAAALKDPRVRHWWDGERAVGRWFFARLPALQAYAAPGTRKPQHDVLWDAYLLYDARAEWRDGAPVPVSWGYTIMRTRDSLVRDLKRVLTPRARPTRASRGPGDDRS